jgi:HSP20 family protein
MSLVKFRNNFPSLINEFIGKDMDELFNFDGPLFNRGFVPAVNVREYNDNFHVEVAAPGMKKDDFKITLDNCVLTVAVEKQHENEEKENRYNRREFSYQSFTRSFRLPDSCNSEKIDAHYQDGILHLAIAKKEEAKRIAPRMIEIA